jgi:hypothetical protein
VSSVNGLPIFFGLAFPEPSDVGNSFAEDLVPNMPDDKRIEQFSDYALNTYIDDTTATFPTSTWSEVPSLVRRTNNGPEAFPSHYNEQFYISHPSMFIFIDTLTKLQAITYMYRYVKLRSTNAEAVHTRKELEKEQFLIEKYSKWMSVDITRQQFVFAVSYKNQPLVK